MSAAVFQCPCCDGAGSYHADDPLTGRQTACVRETRCPLCSGTGALDLSDSTCLVCDGALDASCEYEWDPHFGSLERVRCRACVEADNAQRRERGRSTAVSDYFDRGVAIADMRRRRSGDAPWDEGYRAGLAWIEAGGKEGGGVMKPSDAEKLGGHASTATCESMSLVHWRHHVELAALQAGASAEAVEALRDRMTRAYRAGEPVWMAAHELITSAQIRARFAMRDGDDRAGLRASLRARLKAQ